jgi:hypothetical protein
VLFYIKINQKKKNPKTISLFKKAIEALRRVLGKVLSCTHLAGH